MSGTGGLPVGADLGCGSTAAHGSVPLRHGLPAREARIATVRALLGTHEAALGGSAPDHGRWVTTALAAAVTELGGMAPAADELRALSVGDRHALLLALIAVTYNPALEWVVTCPVCESRLDAGVDAWAIARDTGTEPESAGGLPPGVRLPNGADLEALAELDGADFGTGRRMLLERCVDAADSLNEDAVAHIEARMALEDPLADIELLLNCSDCGTALPADLDPVAELAARLPSGRRLMEDVHALALAYGWTEPEVLALPAPRRGGYLALVADGAP
jgi:hypothetical protein